MFSLVFNGEIKMSYGEPILQLVNHTIHCLVLMCNKIVLIENNNLYYKFKKIAI
jgi:hypothetical protein